jgi:hypothetical protein
MLIPTYEPAHRLTCASVMQLSSAPGGNIDPGAGTPRRLFVARRNRLKPRRGMPPRLAFQSDIVRCAENSCCSLASLTFRQTWQPTN